MRSALALLVVLLALATWLFWRGGGERAPSAAEPRGAADAVARTASLASSPGLDPPPRAGVAPEPEPRARAAQVPTSPLEGRPDGPGLTGRAVDAIGAEPLAGVRVRVSFGDEHEHRSASLVTGRDGRFRVALAGEPGRAWWEGELALSSADQTLQAARDLPPFDPGLDLELGDVPLSPGFELGLRVVDPDGEPIEGAVALLGVESFHLDGPRARSDARGECTLRGLALGTREVCVVSAYHTRARVPIPPALIGAGAAAGRLRVVLTPDSALTLQLEVEDPAEALGLSVGLFADGPLFSDADPTGPHLRNRLLPGSTGGSSAAPQEAANGVEPAASWRSAFLRGRKRIRLVGLRPGRVDAILYGAAGAVLGERTVELTAGCRETLTFERPRPGLRLRGRVLLPTGLPPEQGWVVVTAAGAERGAAGREGTGSTVAIGPRGRFATRPVRARTVGLSVRLAGQEVLRLEDVPVPPTGELGDLVPEHR